MTTALASAVFYWHCQPLQYVLFCHKSLLVDGKKERVSTSINFLSLWDNSCLSSSASAVRYASCDLSLRWPFLHHGSHGLEVWLEYRTIWKWNVPICAIALRVLLTKVRDLCMKHCLLLPFERHYSITHLRPGGHFMYHTVHLLSTRFIYVLWSDYFAVQT